ncbi:hypothetical protein VaNZ11_003407, partial [Volvox africanus]
GPPVYPDTSYRRLMVDSLGLGLPTDDDMIAQLLNDIEGGGPGVIGEELFVRVEPTSSSSSADHFDILHACGATEDTTITALETSSNKNQQGYSNELRQQNGENQEREQSFNELVELLRSDIAHAGFIEVLTWPLVLHEDNFRKLRRIDDG